jgi:phosphatidylglycerol:prolipoprotein diacylglycerol transferase
MALAFVVGGLVARRPGPRPAMSRIEQAAVLAGALTGSMVAAKLPYLFTDMEALRTGRAWLENGRTITWGLAGGYLGVEMAKWAVGVTQKTGDRFAPSVAASIAVGRLGCFVGGCCAGKPTSLPWAHDFGDGVARHPTQIYEFFFHATACAVLLWMERRRLFPLQRFKLYLAAYFLFRVLIEPIRDEPVWRAGLTFYQWSALVFLGIVALLWRRDRPLAAAAAA